MDTIELNLQESHTVTLKGLGAAGYRWKAVVENPRIVRIAVVDWKAAAEMARKFPPGQSRDEQYLLTGLATGETTVRFTQGRSFEPATAPHATYEILVHVGSR